MTTLKVKDTVDSAPGGFSALFERVTNSGVYRTGAGIVHWTMDKIWPVYSIGMVVAAVALVGAVHEKQALADFFYGQATSEQLEEAARLAQASMDDETTHLVKTEIFSLSRAKFRSEASAADL